MTFIENEIYHIYNRGNNRVPIFYSHENYLFFLEKIRKYILPHCDILCYCLMPNHFHLLVSTDNRTTMTKKNGLDDVNVLSEGFRFLLSSYAQAINKQNGSIGSLFQQNTKAKELIRQVDGLIAFHYIHQNPLKALLCKKIEDWKYSSFQDYIGLRNGTICNKKLAYSLLDIDIKNLYRDSYQIIVDEKILNNIY